MIDRRFFADADLPFHVWVREGSGTGSRWVLRHASELHRTGHTQATTASAGKARSRPPKLSP